MSEFYSRYFTNAQKPKKLLIFLHGYNNTLSEMMPVYQSLCDVVKGLVIAAPQGKMHSDKEQNRKSWYKISGFDAEGKRFQEETSVEEIAQIYQQAAPVLSATAREVNAYIDKVQKKYCLDDAHTYIAGFSQGAMLAIWTALTRERQLKGCFVLSGLAAANQPLEAKIKSRPYVYLFHGQKDDKVLFKCMDYTKRWLQSQKVPVQAKAYARLKHEICAQELNSLSQIMNQPSA